MPWQFNRFWFFNRRHNKYQLILFVLVFLFPLTVLSQIHYVVPVNTGGGVSHSVILDIIQDKHGFIWVATGNGLNRFDGYNFRIFRHSEKNANSVSHDIANSIVEDKDGFIWIATQEGLDRYDPVEEKFEHYINLISEQNTGNIVQKVFVDHSNTLWAATSSGVIVSIKGNSGVCRKYLLSDFMPKGRNPGGITFFNEFPDDYIWMGSALGGLFLIDVKKNTVQNFLIDTIDFGDRNQVSSLFVLNTDTLLITGSNLFYFLPKTGTFEKVTNFLPENLKLLCQATNTELWIYSSHDHTVYSFNCLNKQWQKLDLYFHDDSGGFSDEIGAAFKDRSQIIWLGITKKGLFKIDLNQKQFFRIPLYWNNKPVPYRAAGIFEDSYRRIWMVTLEGKMYCKQASEKHYREELHKVNFPGLKIRWYGSFIEDQYRRIWFSSWFWEVFRFDIQTGKQAWKVKNIMAMSPEKHDVAGWAPRKLTMDKNGNVWIAYYDAGVQRIDIRTGTSTIYNTLSVPALSSNQVWFVFPASDGRLFLGTEDAGFDILDPKTETITNFRKSDKPGNGLLSNSVRCFAEDSRGNIWIGTSGGGLSCLHSASRKIITWLQEDGLSNNVVYGILIDNKGNVWCSTEGGLSMFMPVISDTGVAGIFRNYYASDGIGGNEYNINCCLKTSDGKMIFGGNHGFVSFYPDSIFPNPVLPNPIITGLRLFNNPVEVGQVINRQLVLERSIHYKKDLILSYKNRDFTIEFSCDHYAVPEKNKFRYMLENYDSDWKLVSSDRRYATYTNLKPGRYVFKVKALNSDGLESPVPAMINLRITPPWYLSFGAIILYFLTTVLLFYLLFHILRYRAEYKQKYLLERLEKGKQLEIANQKRYYEHMKVQFYTKITHEFRTPLTLILTPLEQLMKLPADKKVKDYYRIIKRNALRLLELVNQLLDIGRIQEGNIVLRSKHGDLVQYLREIYENFLPVTRESHLRFYFKCNVDQFIVSTDTDKLEKIVTNLIANAIKYTNPDGEIELKLKVDGNTYEISVRNSGPGIKPDELPYVFDSFYQASNKPYRLKGGAGLGLTLVKELVEIMGGTITAKSEDSLTTFSVQFPLPEQVKDHKTDTASDLCLTEERQGDYVLEYNDKERLRILIVDDDEDLRWFLKHELKKHFDIEEAIDGNDGYRKAIATLPDLVICDVMMPGMNGYLFCRKLKSDPRVDHIPVILLSARRKEENQIEGLMEGAVDFITKPFSLDVLISKIFSIISLRMNLHEEIRKEGPVSWLEKSVKTNEKEFVKKLVNLIRDQMTNSKLDADYLARCLGMSRTNFYKKVKSITGLSVNDFVNSVRLNEAAFLLKEGKLTIGEIAFKTGFNDHSYFSKCFKKQFGVLPKDYSRNNEG